MVQTDQDDTMYAGNKRTLRFTCTDEDNNDAPLDLTPFTVKWALTKLNTEGTFLVSPTVVEKITGGGGITISGAGNNIASVALVGADTDAIFGEFYHELEVFDGSGESVVLATGKLTIIRNVENEL